MHGFYSFLESNCQKLVSRAQILQFWDQNVFHVNPLSVWLIPYILANISQLEGCVLLKWSLY